MPWQKHHKRARWKGHEKFRDNLHSLRVCNKITIYKRRWVEFQIIPRFSNTFI